MEELLIEEKAKRYDGNYKAYIELINRLEDVKEAIKKQNYGIAMDVLCKSYPEFQVTTHSELKESEDERIRKELLQIVKENEDSFYMVMTPNKREKLIAWLEKGAKGNEREIPIPEPPLTIKHAKEVMGIKQDDAWSEEDELMLMSIIQTLKLTNGAAQMKIDWLNSLKERVQPQNIVYYNPYKEVVESIAEMCKHYDKASHSGLRDFYDDVKVKCKDAKEYESLYPQSTWKPSDEQMNALNYVVNLMASSERPTENDLYYNILKSLRQQLMKLKG